MRNIGTILAVGLTAIIVIVIGIFSFLPEVEADQASNNATPQATDLSLIVSDPASMQAAFAAREALLEAQIQELDGVLADRQQTYQARAQELADLIAAAEAQSAQLSEQETALQQQIEQLQTAQAERTTTYEGQRQQAYFQYQTSIDQLKLQLDEANAKLAETLAQLSQ
jgi:DNA anti-recombination protein RmuC